MFKTQKKQQPLDEIELMSGQEMVELSGQELMNVVGGENEKKDDNDKMAQVNGPAGTGGTLYTPPQGTVSTPVAMIQPGGGT